MIFIANKWYHEAAQKSCNKPTFQVPPDDEKNGIEYK